MQRVGGAGLEGVFVSHMLSKFNTLDRQFNQEERKGHMVKKKGQER